MKKSSPKRAKNSKRIKRVTHVLPEPKTAEMAPATIQVVDIPQPAANASEKKLESGSVWPMTFMFVIVILLLPFLIDYVAQFAITVLGAKSLFVEHRWFRTVAAYVPIYLFMLFYLKTTFNPLSFYGYKWNTQYCGWAVYLGIGSGVIMYFMDKIAGIEGLGVPSFSLTVFFGYLLAWVILPSLTEETLFRGVIQNFFQRRSNRTITKYSIHIGIFIAVAFELAFHLSAPVYYALGTGGVAQTIISHIPQLIYVFIFGSIGGYIYQRTGSLVGPMTIHALGNLTELILIWLFR